MRLRRPSPRAAAPIIKCQYVIPTTPFAIQFSYMYMYARIPNPTQPLNPPAERVPSPISVRYRAVGMGGTKIDERPLRVEPTGGRDLRSKRRRHRRRVCCGFTVAIVAIIVIVLVILGLTVLKAKDPKITINSMTLDNVDFALGTSGALVRLNVTLNIDMAVKNPNKASFKFRNSTTAVDYRGTTVAEAYLPPGKIPAGKTAHLRPLVTVWADRFASNSQLLSDIMGTLPLATSTRLVGRVNVLNIFKHHAVAYASCNISISLAQRQIESMICTRKVKL